ncbi:VanZ family protein [Microbacterium caowuchunii]|uniref:VanZ family protein n=1 Tax=Microbacterium caowuchunii TaxID=2614638 RepID=UPI0023B12628|nr:VanZ family protein [Microbacterium caowuchunii]
MPREASPPPPPRARLWIALGGLLAYAGVVLTATMWPTPLNRGYESSVGKIVEVLHRVGFPEWFGYSALEFTANMAMFLPLGFLVALALPRRGMWSAALLIAGFSVVIEILQALVLAERHASTLDVVANTIGGCVGIAAAAAVRAAVSARDRQIIDRALWFDRAAAR